MRLDCVLVVLAIDGYLIMRYLATARLREHDEIEGL